MLPNKLQRIIDKLDYIELDVEIRKFEWSPKLTTCDLLITDTEESDRGEMVRMTASGCFDFYLDRESGSSNMHLTNNSPLLWRFNDARCDLYFNGRAEQVEKLAYELWQINDSLFSQRLPLDAGLIKSLKGGYGLLAKGSKKLMSEFSKCLNKNGIKTSIVGDLPPTCDDRDLSIFFIGGSYFIACGFDFEIVA